MPLNPKTSGMNAPDYLVESIPNVLHGPLVKPPRAWPALIFPLLLSLAAGTLCYIAAGVSLGLFLGGLILIPLLKAPLVAAETTWLSRALAAFGISHGVAGVWLFAILKADLDLNLFAASYLTLITLVFAIAGFTVMLQRFGFGPLAAGAIATTLTLAWLTWPLWLSPALLGQKGDAIVAWLIPAHPIFAANGALRIPLGYWAEQAIAYNLTNLGDDIAYSVPNSILYCVLLNIATGGACVTIACIRRNPKRNPEARR